jgi:hypothetical protein
MMTLVRYERKMWWPILRSGRSLKTWIRITSVRAENLGSVYFAELTEEC